MDTLDDALRMIRSFNEAAWSTSWKDVAGVKVRVATPRTLYRMKKGTVRPIDHSDAAALRRAFHLDAD